jgi:hypothetical protein
MFLKTVSTDSTVVRSGTAYFTVDRCHTLQENVNFLLTTHMSTWHSTKGSRSLKPQLQRTKFYKVRTMLFTTFLRGFADERATRSRKRLSFRRFLCFHSSFPRFNKRIYVCQIPDRRFVPHFMICPPAKPLTPVRLAQ